MNDLDSRPRSRRAAAAALLPTTLAVVLTVLAIGTLDRTGPATTAAPAVPASSQPPAGSAAGTSIVLRLPDGAATATLEDTPAGREFGALLPLQMTLRDPMGQAKSGRLPTPMAVTDAGRVLDPDVAGLYYWPPSGHLAIFYDDLGHTVPPPGLVRLGTLTSGLPSLASAGNRFAVTIARD